MVDQPKPQSKVKTHALAVFGILLIFFIGYQSGIAVAVFCFALLICVGDFEKRIAKLEVRTEAIWIVTSRLNAAVDTSKLPGYAEGGIIK